MPKYRLVLHRKAEKFLDDLDEKTKQRVLEGILCLADFSGRKRHLDIVKMEGQKDFYRLRTGKVRVMFSVEKKSGTIIILKIARREAAYE